MGRATSHPQGKTGPSTRIGQSSTLRRNKKPVQGVSQETFPRLYFDLKQSLHQDEIGVTKSDVLFDCVYTFGLNWGRDLLGALTAIHHRYVE